MLRSSGEHLHLSFEDPYAGYDMQEYGETRVASAQAPDALSEWVGQVLLDAALIAGYGSPVGGVRFRFKGGDLVVASLADEWVLARGGLPPELETYLTTQEWIDGGGRRSRS